MKQHYSSVPTVGVDANFKPTFDSLTRHIESSTETNKSDHCEILRWLRRGGGFYRAREVSRRLNTSTNTECDLVYRHSKRIDSIYFPPLTLKSQPVSVVLNSCIALNNRLSSCKSLRDKENALRDVAQFPAHTWHKFGGVTGWQTVMNNVIHFLEQCRPLEKEAKYINPTVPPISLTTSPYFDVDADSCNINEDSIVGPTHNSPHKSVIGMDADSCKYQQDCTVALTYKPQAPTESVQLERLVHRNADLCKYLKDHRHGDFVMNPIQKTAGPHTLTSTQAKAEDYIKSVITSYIMTTSEGRNWLRRCQLDVESFTIDRIIPRNGTYTGLNCVQNLVLMPCRSNAYFGDRMDAEKRKYIGNLGVNVALDVHRWFRRQAEHAVDFSAYRHATTTLHNKRKCISHICEYGK
jgi:hypothetical protein